MRLNIYSRYYLYLIVLTDIHAPFGCVVVKQQRLCLLIHNFRPLVSMPYSSIGCHTYCGRFLPLKHQNIGRSGYRNVSVFNHNARKLTELQITKTLDGFVVFN